jgi:hypothetical protein
MYIAIIVAVAFIATTAYIMVLVFKKRSNKPIQ